MRRFVGRPNALMVGVSGVRGILGDGMNPDVAARYTAAYSTRVPGGLVVVGRDTRPSGPLLASAVFSTLRFNGVDVVDLGISSTPTVELMVQEIGADGGIIITASHNGPEWNALKFLRNDGEFLSAQEMDELQRLAESDEQLYGAFDRTGTLVPNDSGDAVHIRRIMELERVDRERIASRGFKAAVDCVNGAGSHIVPALLRSLGVSVVEIHTDVNAPFPHDPEPRPANLAELSELVGREGADIGFACDPDADRLILVDEEGTVCSEELTLAVSADFVLKHEKGPFVANLSTSRLVEDIGRLYGVPVERSKVGEVNVISVMKETGAAIGGEGNGGVIYPPLHYGRDAMVGITLVLQSLADEGVSLKEKVSSLPRYSIVKEKIPFGKDITGVEDILKEKFPGTVNTQDGIRIDMEEGWIHLRKSNTEPVLRIIAESGRHEEACKLVQNVRTILEASK